MKRHSICVALFLIGLCLPAPATTYTVNLDGSADFTTIQSAIDTATHGDEIIVSKFTQAGLL